MNSTIDKPEPFLLRPAAKDYLWGGNRLNDDFGKGIDISPLAETWECSTHPDGLSIVASGKYEGMTLKDVLKLHPEYIGTHPKTDWDGNLPILIKLIDAKNDLSVQVHPSDEYAKEHENGQLGKTEMWYVLDAKKDASLVYGFKFDIDKNTVRKSITDGTLERYLNKIPVKKDDVFFIEAGTVHAIGAGSLIAEVQENSNLTYRLYDYNRVDKNGVKRPLHVDKALDVAGYKCCYGPKQQMRVRKFYNGYSTDLLCRCKYFMVERIIVNTEIERRLLSICSVEGSFNVLLCADGCGTMFFGGSVLKFYKGDCVFVPADSINYSIHGVSQIIRISC